ncbi:MAG TPA: hypothetical protein DCM57_03395 [Treponema sp.]|nr:hypothetical protein [Treponema sp.]
MRRKIQKVWLTVIIVVSILSFLIGAGVLLRSFKISTLGTTIFEPPHNEISGSLDGRRVLFISSYNEESPVFQKEREGVLSVFSSVNVGMDVEFMNARAFPTEDNEKLFYNLLKYRLSEVKKYDAVIAGDDDALSFVERHQISLFEGLPIVFLGVSDLDRAQRASQNPWITGCLERFEFDALLDVALAQNPGAESLVAIYDGSNTASGNLAQLFSLKINYPNLFFRGINTASLSLNQIKKEIAALGKDSIVICLSGFEDGDGLTYNVAEVASYVTESASVPVYTNISGSMGLGFLGGRLVDMKDCGERAANMLLEVFHGKSLADLPMETDCKSDFIFDYKVAKSFHIETKSVPNGTKWINRYSIFWMKNGGVVVSILFMALGVLGIFIVLLFERHRSKLIAHQLSESHDKLKFMVTHDFLTGLPNLQAAHKIISDLIQQEKKFSAVRINITNFKGINDSYTHICGDAVLREIAGILQSLGDEDYFAARDSSEFILVFKSGCLSEASSHFASLKQKLISVPFEFNGSSFTINTKMGIVSVLPGDNYSTDLVMTDVDYALLNAKSDPKVHYKFFTEQMKEELRTTKEIVRILDEACNEDGFEPVFQPQISIETGDVFGYESLCRLKDHTISPALFIPVAESNGFITKIGRIMTEKVVQQMAALRDEGHPLKQFAINYSAGQIVDTGYVDFLRGLLKKYDIPPHKIEIEITESLYLGKNSDSEALFRQLEELGVNLALDDFGTGYSSISYLTYLPVGVVKIDKTMVDVYLHDGKDVLIQNIISMVHSLGMKLVAEGIEEEWQYEKLKDFDCDVIQGYYFSKPLPGQEVKHFRVS